MMQCIPSPHADALSAAIQQLSRPTSVRASGEVTTLRYAKRTGADNVTYLLLDDADMVRVHAEADSGSIAALLAGHVTSGLLTQGQLDAMTADIEAARVSGQPVRVWDLIPSPFKAEAKSWQQMVEKKIFTLGGMP